MEYLGKKSLYKTIALLVVTSYIITTHNVANGQQVGVCLISCGQKVVTCDEECIAKPSLQCYEACGTADIECVNGCLSGAAKTSPSPSPPPPTTFTRFNGDVNHGRVKMYHDDTIDEIMLDD
ncbi:hypothetical protein LIER_24765 [Lithospermum erythrorhizon]|uniref:Uncharacterized protein n=1 Tax=Lithospermum erythrorhizon TaxID=34254 RepID=A0AAV3R3V5_LITER